MKFLKGQRVRLTPQGIRAHVKSHGKLHRSRLVKWKGRTGIIQEISNWGARVTWDGNKYPADVLALTVLELVETDDDGPDHNSSLDDYLRGDHCPYCGSRV